MKIVKIFLLFFLWSLVSGQTGEIVPLSQKVGTVLDAEENLFYHVFTDIDGFESAQFYEVSSRAVLAKIVFVEYSQKKISKRKYTIREFLRMKEAVDLQPFITDEDRRSFRDNLTYLQTNDILGNIPMNQFVSIKHRSGRSIKGTLLNYENKIIKVQTAAIMTRIPIWEMESISYRKLIHERVKWKYPLFAFSALSGLVLAEGWNVQTNPLIDKIWHYRFLGTVVGLLAGIEVFQTFNILTSPKTFFSLTPEEMNRLKE